MGRSAALVQAGCVATKAAYQTYGPQLGAAVGAGVGLARRWLNSTRYDSGAGRSTATALRYRHRTRSRTMLRKRSRRGRRRPFGRKRRFRKAVRKVLRTSGKRKFLRIDNVAGSDPLVNTLSTLLANHKALVWQMFYSDAWFPTQGSERDQYNGDKYQYLGCRIQMPILIYDNCPVMSMTIYHITANEHISVTPASTRPLSDFWERMHEVVANKVALTSGAYNIETGAKLKAGFRIRRKWRIGKTQSDPIFLAGTRTWAANGNNWANTDPIEEDRRPYLCAPRTMYLNLMLRNKIRVRAQFSDDGTTAPQRPEQRRVNHYLVIVPHSDFAPEGQWIGSVLAKTSVECYFRDGIVGT